MGIPRELISGLLKYRKRKQRSISPTIPGYAGQCDFVRPRTRVPGENYVIPPGSVVTPEVYMGDLPDDYIPDAGFMEVFEPDYGPYETQSFQPPFTPAIGFGSLPQNFEVVGVEYDDCLMTQELFEHQMRLANHLDSIPLDLEQMIELQANQDFIDEVFEGIDERLMSLSDPAPEASLPPDAVNAIDVFQLPAVEPLAGQMNYAAMDPHDFFEQQMQMMDNHFDQFDPSLGMDKAFNAQEVLFDMSQPTIPFGPILMEPLGMPGVGSLDDIVEASMQPAPMYGPEMPAYGSGPMTQELFDQQMHEAAGQMGAPEAAQGPYDDGMPGDMYGEAMPYDAPDMTDPQMMDPYMMDPHMMNPYMMPGPMGPNYMPDPPPGP